MWSFQCFIFIQTEYKDKYDKGDFWGSNGEEKTALLREKSMTTVAQEASQLLGIPLQTRRGLRIAHKHSRGQLPVRRP